MNAHSETALTTAAGTMKNESPTNESRNRPVIDGAQQGAPQEYAAVGDRPSQHGVDQAALLENR